MSLRSRWTPDCRRAALRVLGIAAVCMAFMAAVCHFLHLRYTTNDDTGIIGFIVAGHPVPYVGILLTSLLQRFYAAWPNVAWFGWCLYLLLAISLYQWLGLAWRLLRRPWLAAAASAVILGYYLDLVVSLDFTAVSALLCMAALARAGVEVLEQRAPRSLLVPSLLFALGWLVRPESAFGAMAYAVPAAAAVLVACLWHRPLRPEAGRLAVAGLVFLLPVALNAGVDAVWRAAVRTPQQAQYEAFNTAGGRFYHLNAARREATGKDKALLASLHWTPRDSKLFMHWKFLDERVYTPEALRALSAHAAAPVITAQLLKRQIKGRIYPRNNMFLLLVASLPLFALLLYRIFPAGAIGLLLPAYSVALTAFMYLLYAFVYRVEMPFELGLGLMGLLLGLALLERSGAATSRAFLAVACLSILVAGFGAWCSLHATLRLQRHDRAVAARAGRELRMLNTRFAGDVVLMQPLSMGLNVFSPLQPIQLRFHPINLGWNTFSPRFYEQISWAGAEHGYELIDAMVDNPKAYLLGWQSWARELLWYAKAHPQGRIRMVRVSRGIQQLRSMPAADGGPAGR